MNELFARQNRTKCSESSAYSGQIKTFSNAYTPPVVQQRNISRTVVPSDITFQKAEVSDYTVGSVIKHNNLGIGTIIDITEIIEGVKIITIRFTDGRTDKLSLEPVVQKNLIMIGVRDETTNE